MSEQCMDTLRCNPQDLRQAMSIHTQKITDACRDKDCIEDLRVYLTTGSQTLLDTCASARVRCGELLYTYIDVEPVAFDRNHYCIDVTFYYRILADAVVGAGRPAALYGLAVFSKRAVLCGEDSCAHIFRSDTRIGERDGITRVYANRPTAVVEVTDTNSQNTQPTHIHKTHLNAAAFFNAAAFLFHLEQAIQTSSFEDTFICRYLLILVKLSFIIISES